MEKKLDLLLVVAPFDVVDNEEAEDEDEDEGCFGRSIPGSMRCAAATAAVVGVGITRPGGGGGRDGLEEDAEVRSITVLYWGCCSLFVH